MPKITVSEQLFENKQLQDFLERKDLIARRSILIKEDDQSLTIEKIEEYFSESLGEDVFENIKEVTFERNDGEFNSICIGHIWIRENSVDLALGREPFELDFGGKLFFDEEKMILQYIGIDDELNRDAHTLWEIKKKS